MKRAVVSSVDSVRGVALVGVIPVDRPSRSKRRTYVIPNKSSHHPTDGEGYDKIRSSLERARDNVRDKFGGHKWGLCMGIIYRGLEPGGLP